MIGNATVIEIGWSLIAAVGLVLSLYVYAQARADLKFLMDRNYNGRRRILARGHLRREGVRAIIQAIFLMVGALSMASPPPPGRPALVINPAVVLLITAAVLIVFNTFGDLRDRQTMLDYWRKVDLSHTTSRDATLVERSTQEIRTHELHQRHDDQEQEEETDG